MFSGLNANQNENISSSVTSTTNTLGSPIATNAPASPTTTNSLIVAGGAGGGGASGSGTSAQAGTGLGNEDTLSISTTTTTLPPDNNEVVCVTPPQRHSINSNEYQTSTPKSTRSTTAGSSGGAVAAVGGGDSGAGGSSSPVNSSVVVVGGDSVNNNANIAATNEESPLPQNFNNIESSTFNESQLMATGAAAATATTANANDNPNSGSSSGGGICINSATNSAAGGVAGCQSNLNSGLGGINNMPLTQNQQILNNYAVGLTNPQNGSNRNYNPILIPQRQSLLPWGTHSRSSIINIMPYTTAVAAAPGSATNACQMDSSNDANSLRPGEIVMRNLFSDFTLQAEKKIELVMLESADKPLSKLLQRGEDQQFDQLLSALGNVAEHCLPSLLHTLLAWHRRQLSDAEIKNDLKRMEKTANLTKPLNSQELDFQLQRREAAVEFIFCLALIEILKQLPFHPGHEDLVRSIENLAFKHFKYKEGLQNNPNAHNIHMIADLYAEVIGVLAQSRFSSVRKRFMSELKELRTKEPSPHTTQSIISLLMGMKFFRVKVSFNDDIWVSEEMYSN